MKAKFLTILFVSVSMFFIACDEESITEAVLGSNSVELSGVITKSYDTQAVAGLMEEDSSSIFAIFVQPKNSLSFDTDILGMMKVSDIIPPVGNYKIGESFLEGNDFFATFTPNDSTIYFMSSGSVKITKSSSSKIEGTFDMSGYQLTFPVDSTKVLNVSGEFSTIPTDLN